MEQLFRLSIVAVLFFTVLYLFAWLFGANLVRIGMYWYYSTAICVCLFGINLLFGFRKGK